MKLLSQKLKNGQVDIAEVPVPLVAPGTILIRNYYSLISAGTEGSIVKAARKSLLGKAKERPQQVKQVLSVLKTQGVSQTIRAVTKKLESLSPLGYSCVGKVIEVGDGVTGFKVGDYVACGGNTANHADIVAVPANLCVRLALDEEGDIELQLKAAAYNTLGAIAMQGVRQADVRLGETCAVIGLGLIGQLSCQLLRASGVKVVGIDIDKAAVETAGQHCTDLALLQSDPGTAAQIESFSNGLGVDAVIITAAASDTGPINFAGEIARKRGRVVVVGDVQTGFDREPHYYRKELELRMSCSYGPGRYDPGYEEKGHDYPPAYVRWTENRNMAAFQELVSSGAIDIGYLTTHEFALEDAPQAYDMIVNKSEPYLGVLIRYDVDRPIAREKISVRTVGATGKVSLAFIGAGNYAQGNLLPNLPRNDPDVVRKIVMTNSGATSRGVAERFDFEACTSNKQDILDDPGINTVFISTRHDSHSGYVVDALQAGKHVFVDKPLCLTPEELAEIEPAYSSCDQPRALMLGYNRRFAPLAVKMKERFKDGPMAMLYRVNAGPIAVDHWIQDPEVGGGRIIGEVCHFVDFMVFMCGSLPVSVQASAMPDPKNLSDSVNISLEFSNGSIGSILYISNGSKSLFKEYIEVYQDGQTALLRDFKALELHGKGRPARKKLTGQDKGQATMLSEFLNVIRNGGESPIKPPEAFAVSRATFAAVESLRSGQKVTI